MHAFPYARSLNQAINTIKKVAQQREARAPYQRPRWVSYKHPKFMPYPDVSGGKKTLLIIPRLKTASSDLKASSISSNPVLTMEEPTATESFFFWRGPYVWRCDVVIARLPGQIFRVDARIVISPSLVPAMARLAVDHVPVMRRSSWCRTAYPLISFTRDDQRVG